MTCLLRLLYVCCSFLLVAAATTPNFAAQINIIPMLSGMNFKSWKESAEIVLGCMDLDLSLREECGFILEGGAPGCYSRESE